MKILIAEDERRMEELLRKGLQEEGHTVVVAFDACDSISLARAYDFDVILLDVMMPQMDGFEVARRLRQLNLQASIIMLTARDAVPDIVNGLDVGADDYITKPFSFDELLARLRAVRRRAEFCASPYVEVGDLVLNPESRDVMRAGERITLTRKEYELLERLAHQAGKVVSRQWLIEQVWGGDKDVEDNTLEAFVHLLRGKIERQGLPRLLHIVRGVGYTLRMDRPS